MERAEPNRLIQKANSKLGELRKISVMSNLFHSFFFVFLYFNYRIFLIHLIT
jgi:hypothetical protein